MPAGRSNPGPRATLVTALRDEADVSEKGLDFMDDDDLVNETRVQIGLLRDAAEQIEKLGAAAEGLLDWAERFHAGDTRERLGEPMNGPRTKLMTDPAALARRFHELYEELAPGFGYETRKESAKPWDEVPRENRHLMIAVCAVIQREVDDV